MPVIAQRSAADHAWGDEGTVDVLGVVGEHAQIIGAAVRTGNFEKLIHRTVLAKWSTVRRCHTPGGQPGESVS